MKRKELLKMAYLLNTLVDQFNINKDNPFFDLVKVLSKNLKG